MSSSNSDTLDSYMSSWLSRSLSTSLRLGSLCSDSSMGAFSHAAKNFLRSSAALLRPNAIFFYPIDNNNNNNKTILFIHGIIYTCNWQTLSCEHHNIIALFLMFANIAKSFYYIVSKNIAQASRDVIKCANVM